MSQDDIKTPECGHKLYKAGHCAEMTCLNYVNKCPYCNPAVESSDSPLEKIEQRNLVGLDKSTCEVCGDHLSDHEWVLMDPHGNVVKCSKKPEEVNV